MPRILLAVALLAALVTSNVGAETGSGKLTGSWPCWRGVHANGSAPAQGLKLVDDLAEAREVWVSDQQVPRAYPRNKGSAYWHGGYGIPLVAEGRVYVHYCTPPGRKTYAFTEEDLKYKKRGNRPPFLPDTARDDVVHCFDAATGKTLWRTIFAGKGLADNDGSRAHMGACYYRGRIYAPGSGVTMYCVDAETGRPVWEAPVANLDSKRRPPSRLMLPTAIDGVVAGGAGRLTGYDAENGAKLWTAEKVSGGKESPIVWRHAGKGYFFLDGALVEAKTGRLCWQIPHACNEQAAAISGDILVIKKLGSASGREKPTAGPLCYRISPAKYERLWSFEEWPYYRHAITILDGKVLYCRSSDKQHNKAGAYVARDLQTGKLIATAPCGGETAYGYHAIGFEGRTLALQNANLRYFDLTGGTWKKLGGDLPAGRKCQNSISPTYVDGFLYVRTCPQGEEPGRLVCYDLRKPER